MLCTWENPNRYSRMTWQGVVDFGMRFILWGFNQNASHRPDLLPQIHSEDDHSRPARVGNRHLWRIQAVHAIPWPVGFSGVVDGFNMFQPSQIPECLSLDTLREISEHNSSARWFSRITEQAIIKQTLALPRILPWVWSSWGGMELILFQTMRQKHWLNEWYPTNSV